MARFPSFSSIALVVSAATLLVAAHHAQGAPGSSAATVYGAPADANLVAAGRQLAVAGDCAGCHGPSLKGGAAVASPMGAIYASNITPDRATGIGGWTLRQFSDVMRKGVSPHGRIYPAMPYTSFTGLDDAQIAALYAYLMRGVRPVAYRPRRTDLPFPFVRPAMIAWNAMFLREGRAVGAVQVQGAQVERGRVLAEQLGHCTTCHTPRGQMMQERSDRHLGGAFVGGWWAPNITPDPSGIGGWSDARLTTFLTTGHTAVAVAGDDMALVVSRSLSRLPAADIAAIVAYLRAVPPVKADQPVRAAAAPPLDVAAIEPADNLGWKKMLGSSTTRGGLLYQAACAACHGADGGGSAGLRHPSLRLVQGVRAPGGATLVQAIVHGVDRRVGDAHAFMPPFRGQFSDEQIAALANYVRTTFGGLESDLTASQVAAIVDGRIGVPWIIRNAHWLSVVAFLVVLAAVAAVIWRTLAARSRRASAD